MVWSLWFPWHSMITVIENIFMLIMRKFLMAELRVVESFITAERKGMHCQSRWWSLTLKKGLFKARVKIETEPTRARLASAECLLINFSTTAGVAGWGWWLTDKIIDNYHSEFYTERPSGQTGLVLISESYPIANLGSDTFPPHHTLHWPCSLGWSSLS